MRMPKRLRVSAETIRRVLPVGLLAVVVFSVLSFRNDALPGYLHIWSVWASGGVTSSLSLWGMRMMWWGRVGKLLQFTAGLAVVFDLIKTESLRAFGEHASIRWRRNRDYFRLIRIFRIWQLSRELFGSLHDFYEDSFRGYAVRVPYLRHTEPERLERPPKEIDGEVLFEFQKELLATVRRSSNRDGWSVAYPIIFDFLYARLPPDQRISPHALNKWARWGSNRLVGLVLYVVLSVLWVLLTLRLHWGGSALLLFGVTAIGGLLAIDYIVYLVSWMILAPLSMTARFTAQILDRQRPAHALRWAAFVLFIVGFHFDLMSS